MVADEINEACKDSEGGAIVVPCNISDKTALQMLVDETRAQLGKIDILVCNAASNPFFGSMMDIPVYPSWNQKMDLKRHCKPRCLSCLTVL